MLHRAWNNKGEMPYCFPRSSIKFQGHTRQNITDFEPNWAFPDYRPVAAFKSLRFALLFFKWQLVCNFGVVERILFLSIFCLSVLVHYLSFACYFSTFYIFHSEITSFYIKYLVLPHSINIFSTVSYQPLITKISLKITKISFKLRRDQSELNEALF